MCKTWSVILLVNLFLMLTVTISTNTVKHLQQPSTSSAVTDVYIVYTDNPGNNPEAYYLRILTSALGSTNAAKEALVYSYNYIHGFSAKLAPQQANIVEVQHGVFSVVPGGSSTLDDHELQI